MSRNLLQQFQQLHTMTILIEQHFSHVSYMSSLCPKDKSFLPQRYSQVFVLFLNQYKSYLVNLLKTIQLRNITLKSDCFFTLLLSSTS